MLSESRQQVKALDSQADVVQRMTGEIQSLKLAAAKSDGTPESLKEQIVQLRGEVVSTRELAGQARLEAADAQALLTVAQSDLDQLRANQNASVEQQS